MPRAAQKKNIFGDNVKSTDWPQKDHHDGMIQQKDAIFVEINETFSWPILIKNTSCAQLTRSHKVPKTPTLRMTSHLQDVKQSATKGVLLFRFG